MPAVPKVAVAWYQAPFADFWYTSPSVPSAKALMVVLPSFFAAVSQAVRSAPLKLIVDVPACTVTAPFQ